MKKAISSMLVLGLAIGALAMPSVSQAHHRDRVCDDGYCYTAEVQLTPAEAKAIAFQHAGLTEAAVSMKKCELDREHGRMIYEVEFYYNALEYEYEIDANSGVILDFDKETHKHR